MILTECSEPTTSAEVQVQLVLAAESFAILDTESFRLAAKNARGDLSCLSEPLLPSVAAEFHRIEGLKAALDGDDDQAAAEFCAARAIEPEYPLGALSSAKLEELYRLVDPMEVEHVSAPIPFSGRLLFDGAASGYRLGNLPVVVQYVDAMGAVAWTAIVPWGSPLPPLPDVMAPVPLEHKVMATGLGTALAGGLVFAVGYHRFNVAHDIVTPQTSPEELEVLKASYAGWFRVGEVLMVVGGGLVVGGAVMVAF